MPDISEIALFDPGLWLRPLTLTSALDFDLDLDLDLDFDFDFDLVRSVARPMSEGRRGDQPGTFRRTVPGDPPSGPRSTGMGLDFDLKVLILRLT